MKWDIDAVFLIAAAIAPAIFVFAAMMGWVR